MVDCDEPQLSRLHKICQKYGWYILNVNEFLSNYPKEKLIIHPKDPHPTPFAHKLYAENIYQKLIKDDLLPTT